ncbi:MAG TPA: tetratricopeptide repeat protein [Terriglobales bacterium]
MRQRLTVKLIGTLLLQVAILYGEASAQSREMVEASHALYRGEYDRASEIARKYLKLHPGSAAMHVMLARAELTANHPDQAIVELRKALAADPRNVDAHYYLWLTTKTLAQGEYQKLFAMAPGYYRVHQLMGEAAVAAYRPTEAENEFRAALDANPNSLEVLVELGNLKRSQSKYDEAIGFYTKAEHAGPLNYDTAYGLGVCYTFTQEYDRAVHYLKESIRIDPVSPDARLALGSAWLQNGKLEAAVPELERAVQLDPHMNRGYFLLARAYQKLGRKQDAAAAFKKAQQGQE